MKAKREAGKSPAFQFYPNDFLGSGSVGTMTAEEVGIYTLLLCLDWNEVGFVFDVPKLARWCRVSTHKFKSAWQSSVSDCFDERDGRLFNPRLDVERAKQAEWREKSRQGGKTSAEHRAKGGSSVVEPPLQPNVNQDPNQRATLRTSTTDSSLQSPEEPLSASYAQACAIRANQGLLEHATRPQPIARVIATNGSSHAAAEALIAARVPLAFAESTIYELAKSHSAQDQVTSLKYFVPGVVRAWERHGATTDASDATRPATKKRSGDPTFDALQDMLDAEKAKTAAGGSRG